MGAWSADSFGNDTACDWSYELEKVDDLRLVRQAFESVLEDGVDYLELDPACEGIAACEVVARLKGNGGLRNSYTETVDRWVESHPAVPPEDLVQSALAVLDRILAPQSELRELWEEGDAGEWRTALDDLRTRVSS